MYGLAAGICCLLGAQTTFAADEAEAPKPVTTAKGEMTVEWFYDAEALKTAIGEAEAGEDGSKSAVVEGTIVKHCPGGWSETTPTLFTASIDTEGKMGEVSIVASGNPGDLKKNDEGFVSPGVFRSNNTWILIAAALVFIMHLGFSAVESGLCRAKNCVNILTKNVAVVCIGVLAYFAWGFASMYPGADAANWVVPGVFALGAPLGAEVDVSASYYGGSYTGYTDFIFQAMFAATAATIVSGAVAERIKLMPFLVFTVVFVMFGYPFTGSWKWGGGWLQGMGFHDFAGSTLVHAFGGFGALAGVILLGPRLGKYKADGSVSPIPGHSMPLATIGVFMLFLGWFGFNGGSVLSADEAGVSKVFVTTTLAGCAGGMLGLITSWLVFGKPDLSMALNGILAGLVGITAGADAVSPLSSIIIGAIAGGIVVFAVLFFDKIRLDDPVGAISVHGVCGMFGTIAVGIFGDAEYLKGLYGAEGMNPGVVTQIIGTVVISITAFLISLVTFGILKAVGGIRVSEKEELEGLDIGEHGMEAYHGFNTNSAFESK